MKKHKFHKDFKLNGNRFSTVSELIEFSKFSKELNFFLKDWFSDDDFISVNTSGSTGKPKQIQLFKKHIINSAKATGSFFHLPEKTTALCCLPINFIAGKMMVVRALTLGWDMDIIDPNSKPLEAIDKNYDFSAMVPLQVFNSLSKLNQIKKLIIGGGEVSKTLEHELQKVETKVYATYGMTETITHVAVKQLNHIPSQFKLRNFYKALPNIFFSLDDRNCLVIDAPKIAEEQIVTNDVVDLVSDTEFEWRGRFDNVINSGGIKIHPEEIERKLSKVIYNRFFVAGIPDHKLGQKLILLVEGKEDNSLLDIISSSSVQFSHKHEIPKQIFFLDFFLETNTGKIMRDKTLELLN